MNYRILKEQLIVSKMNEYEELGVGECFKKFKYHIYTDYEFFENVGRPSIDVSFQTEKFGINSTTLFFRKVDNETCEEVYTKRKFERINDNFYNYDTGLVFDFNYILEKVNESDILVDDFYKINIQKFFRYYEHIKELDDIKVSKYHSLLLKRSLKYTK